MRAESLVASRVAPTEDLSVVSKAAYLAGLRVALWAAYLVARRAVLTAGPMALMTAAHSVEWSVGTMVAYWVV